MVIRQKPTEALPQLQNAFLNMKKLAIKEGQPKH